MKLSVIIVNYNVRHFLEQALHSVFRAQKNIDLEVFVVDNNSVDQSVEMVIKEFPQVKVIANKENTGFSKANNQAIRESTGEYVLLLNPDTLVQEDTFEICCDFMDSHADCGGLGVRMIDGKGKFLPESKRGLPTPAVALFKMTGLSRIFPKSPIFGKYHLKYLAENEQHAVDVLSGAFMFLRRSVLDKIGLLDEDFFMYGEDIDLSYRITKAGFKNYYIPDTTIIHYKGESTKKKSANYVKVFYNAMVLFAKKHYSNKMAGWFAFFISIAIQFRALLALVWRVFNRAIYFISDFAFAYLGFWAITKYWEQNIKYVRNFYPSEYFWMHIPGYIAVILISVFLSGGYDRPLKSGRISRGVIAGAVVVFAIYGFLPKDMQFSRAILFLGSAWVLIMMPFSRFIFHFIQTGKLSFSSTRGPRVAIVALETEAKRIQNLLVQSGVRHDFLTFISPNDEKPEGYVGTLPQMDEVVSIFNINQVIFSASDVSSATIMATMSKLSGLEINFKIVPENGLVIIGSNSKNGPGELYTIDISFALEEKQVRRKKRIFDLAVVALLIVLLPFCLLFAKTRIMLSQCFWVLLGTKTWIGYKGRPNSEGLPAIKTSVFYPLLAFENSSLESKINLAYARDYNAQKDAQLLWRIIF